MSNTLVVSTEDQRFVVVEEANNTVSISTPADTTVEVRAPGPQGVVGPGVAPGGVTNDLLRKVSSADYDTAWTDSITVDKLTFDTTAAEALGAEGEIAWNAAEETIDVKLNGFTMHTGQHTLYHVQNKSHATIAKGTPVMFGGTDGNSGKLLIDPWNGTGPSQWFMGITAEALNQGESGFVIAFGKLTGIQTDGDNYDEEWFEGDIIYAGSTAGTLTKVAPTAPSPKIIVCAVVSAKKNNGELFIRPTFGSNIGDSQDILISNPQNGDVLAYNASTQVWENVAQEDLVDGGNF